MKHHFADLLDRDGDYWTIVPNTDRYSYTLDDRIVDVENAKIVTIGREQSQWKQIFELPNLLELTLHNPSQEQLEAIGKLNGLKRLRISHARPKNIDFISELKDLEECVFEYVSGFSDLSPFSKLKRLKSLHFENLRKVKDFGGLRGIDGLKYLSINGTLDWNQPIEDFQFLEGLHSLEVFALSFVINRSEFPAMLPILKLEKLKRVKIGLTTLQTKEYALMKAALPNTKCGTHGTRSWEPCSEIGDQVVFLGKGAGQIGAKSKNREKKCEAFTREYERMMLESKLLVEERVAKTRS